MLEVGLVDDPRFELHEQDPGHPEAPARVQVIREALKGLPLEPIPAREATHEELLTVHTAEYIRLVEETCLGPTPAVLGPDVVVSGGTWPAARLAAGSAIEATAWVMAEKERRVFCNIRPPGHHALPSQAMGFCIFNNVALAAMAALKAGAKRVGIVDWDVHHGNGTQEIFWEHASVFYASMHNHPFYPGTGRATRGRVINLPLSPGTSADRQVAAFRAEILPALEAFQPDLIFVSCGFDAHKADPLGQLRLEAGDYAAMTRDLLLLAPAGLVSLLEGGYDLKAIAESAQAHVKALLEEEG